MTPYYRRRFFLCIAETYNDKAIITQCRLDKSHYPRLPHNDENGHTWMKFRGWYESIKESKRTV